MATVAREHLTGCAKSPQSLINTGLEKVWHPWRGHVTKSPQNLIDKGPERFVQNHQPKNYSASG